MSTTTDVHRNIAQLVLDEGIFSEEQLIELLGDCIDKYKDDAKRARLKRTHDEMKDAKTLEAVVESINLQLKPLSLMIARMKSKISGSWETYYGVVNLNEDDGFAKQGWLSKSEQEFFHKLIEEILSSDVRAPPPPPARRRHRPAPSACASTHSCALILCAHL